MGGGISVSYNYSFVYLAPKSFLFFFHRKEREKAIKSLLAKESFSFHMSLLWEFKPVGLFTLWKTSLSYS